MKKTALQEICSKYQTELLTDVSLKEHTTFHIGGKADFWAEITSARELQEILQFCRENGQKYFIMGRGSNVLASDDGFRGLVLHIGSGFSEITVQEETESSVTFLCSAGTILSNVAKFAQEHQLTGMEGLSGIPGTTGGAVFMNAGAYQREMRDIVQSCIYLDENGEQKVLSAKELDFSYRHSWFTDHPGCVILYVEIQLQKGNPEEINAKMNEFAQRRREKQPLNFPSAGSTFKRPKGNYASKLIDECGLRGYRVGDAQVSEKHTGFVVNLKQATCQQVLQLCQDVHDKVYQETGYDLKLEPVLLGEIQKGEFSCS